MRQYALHQAMALEQAQGQSIFAKAFRNWKARRQVTRLQDLDDHILYDIGVTREDIAWAAGLPLADNAAQFLERRATQRRNASRQRPGRGSY